MTSLNGGQVGLMRPPKICSVIPNICPNGTLVYQPAQVASSCVLYYPLNRIQRQAYMILMIDGPGGL